MTTHRRGVILIICSGLALIWSAQSQLTHSSDSCGDIICPGSHVLYTCTFPIRGSVIVVWRMKPECELNIRDIIFIRGTDNRLNTMCDDRRTIEVQGMDTPNGTVFVSTLNVTNITMSQTVECIFDDGSTEESIGNSTVFTTAPAQGAEITAVTPNVVLTLNQAINCPLIEYAVNSSTNCGMCGIVIDDTITCNNALMGSKCTVVVETKLCGIPVNQTVMTFDVTQRPITLSTTPASTQEAGSLSSGEVAAIVVFTLLAVIVVVLIIVAVIYVKEIKGKKFEGTSEEKRRRTEEESTLIQEPKEKEEHHAISNIKLQLEHKDPTIHGEDIATVTKASNIDTGTTSVTETGDNEQQNHDRGDSKEVNEHQNNIEESCYQSNDERDSMEPPCDDQTTLLEVHGDDKDNKRHSEHQNISGRNAVEDDDDEIRSENLEVFDAVPVEESEKSTAQAHDPCDTKSDVPAVLTLENTSVDQAGGNDTIVASSAKNESTKCDSATKHTKEERSSDVFPNREVNTEGKSSTDENQTANSSEGAGSKVQDSSDLTDYVYTIPMVEKKEGRSDVFTNKEVSAEDKSNTDKNQTKAINSSEGAGSTAGEFAGQNEETNPVLNTGDDNPMMVTGGNLTSTGSRYELPHASNSRSFGDNITEPMTQPFITPYGDSNDQAAMETLHPAKPSQFEITVLDQLAKQEKTMEEFQKVMENKIDDLQEKKDETIQKLEGRVNYLESENTKIKSLILKLEQELQKEKVQNTKPKQELQKEKEKNSNLEQELQKAKEKIIEKTTELLKAKQDLKKEKEQKRCLIEKSKIKLQQEKDGKEREVQKKRAELPLKEEAEKIQLKEELVKEEAKIKQINEEVVKEEAEIKQISEELVKIDEEIENLDKELEQMEQED